MVRLGLVQWGPGFDRQANLARSKELLTEAFEAGADIVVLPELAASGYSTEPSHLQSAAEPVSGPTVEAWHELAARYGGLVCGGLCEAADGKLFNSAVLVSPDGVALHYRKLHPFAGEKHVFEPGDLGLPIADTRFGVIGVCVCYDLRFPEVVRALALKGAELVLVPTAWLPGFDEERWDRDGYCPQARGALLQANLNQVFIACASQVGRPVDLEFLGSSLVADPYGKDLAGPPSGTAERVVIAEIDADETHRAQRRSPLISPRSDRRTDVYGISIDGRTL